MHTQRETVRLLCRSIINKLENHKSIVFPPRLRQVIQDEIFTLVGPMILTDEDIKQRALERISTQAEALSQMDAAESDQLRAAKTVVKNSLGDDVLNGFYFQKPLKTVANAIVGYFMRSSHIDDVYETDDDLENQIVNVVKEFNPLELH
ncbi:MAG: DUF507 family protein [Bdellovibrio sp.]|nr:DUF507 family protein [Bdellovibrio sp.]